MARFEFFDSYATHSGSSTYSYSESESRPYNLCEECGDLGSETRFETVSFTANTTEVRVNGLLSSSASYTDNYPGTGVFASNSSTRDNVTNPTYSYTEREGIGGNTITGTSTGGTTFRTTGTTTQVIESKETTASTITNLPLGNVFYHGTYRNPLNTIQVYPQSLITAASSFGTTTQAASITLTISTTLTGYAFCKIIRDAAFLYTLDPWAAGNGDRKSPAYWVTTPLSEGTSFSAISTTGTHRVFDISSAQSVQTASASSEWELLCIAGVNDTWTEAYEPGCPIDATSFSHSTSTHYGSYASSSQSAGTLPAWKTYGTAGGTPLNQYIRKSPTRGLFIDPGQEPSSAQLYSAYSASPAYALGSTAIQALPQAFVSEYYLVDDVLDVRYERIGSPFWFSGTSRGAIASGTSVIQATFSWSGFSSLFYTTGSGASTASARVTFHKTAASSSDFSTEAHEMDVCYPPHIRRTGTEFEPVASYGLSGGTYKLASTNSSGGTASQTSSGIVSSVVDSSAYSRPQRKIAYSYASTTASSSTTNWDGQVPVFSSLYGGVAGYSRSAVSVEESRGNNGERSVA